MGVWIEVPVDQRVVEEAGAVPASHPHVTLHHLGKSLSSPQVIKAVVSTAETTVEHWRAAMHRRAPVAAMAEITGSGVFPRGRNSVEFLLVNSRPLCVLWDMLGHWLEASEALAPLVSKDYGFIPHITVEGWARQPFRRVTFPLQRLLVVQGSDGQRVAEWEVPL